MQQKNTKMSEMMQKREQVLLKKWEDQIQTNKSLLGMGSEAEKKRQSIKENLEMSKDSKIKRGYLKYQQQREQIEDFLARKKQWRQQSVEAKQLEMARNFQEAEAVRQQRGHFKQSKFLNTKLRELSYQESLNQKMMS